MLKKIASGICAGIMISIGGAVFLACENKIVGAISFSVALLTICFMGFSLFTGKVGFMIESHKKENFSVLLLGLLGNVIATTACGYMMRYGLPKLGEAAETICLAKLEQLPLQTFIRAIFCGVLMYIAVSIFRDGKNITGIVFGIPVFIISGFEHSIADMYYFATSGIVSLSAFIFILIVLAGNAVGALILPALGLIGKKGEKNE